MHIREKFHGFRRSSAGINATSCSMHVPALRTNLELYSAVFRSLLACFYFLAASLQHSFFSHMLPTSVPASCQLALSLYLPYTVLLRRYLSLMSTQRRSALQRHSAQHLDTFMVSFMVFWRYMRPCGPCDHWKSYNFGSRCAIIIVF
jgi:hypothetical protein